MKRMWRDQAFTGGATPAPAAFGTAPFTTFPVVAATPLPPPGGIATGFSMPPMNMMAPTAPTVDPNMESQMLELR